MGFTTPLAKPWNQIKQHYDAVVVGSGYGGGVAAFRLARAGRSVCVLERGREFTPGEFSNDWHRTLREVRLSGQRLQLGSKAGLYDFRAGREIHVLTANGLGGGSLINGAVALRPDPKVFEAEGWPQALRQDGLFDVGLDRAEHMLGVSRCPNPEGLPKFLALQRGASALGASIEPVPTTITYRPRTNAADVDQPACHLCGDCWSGCNVGAKNTVPLTYLADAARNGAEIFTLTTVRHVSKSGRQWTVQVESTIAHSNNRRYGQTSITADIVILAAGTLGSTEILLRSRERGLALSDQLGKGFSGNGDEMLIGRDLDAEVNAVAVGVPPRANVGPVGPATIAVIRYRDQDDQDATVLLQDGTMLPLMAMMAPLKAFAEFRWTRAVQLLREGRYRGYRSRAQVYYLVTRDSAGGELRLVRDRLVVDWPDLRKDPCFERGARTARRVIEHLGGVPLNNPLSDRILGGRKITAHPLGGCAMGEDASTGVVDNRCQVFDVSRGGIRDVHEGLYVCDGSIIRSSLGVNPLLTITALAERSMTLLARK